MRESNEGTRSRGREKGRSLRTAKKLIEMGNNAIRIRTSSLSSALELSVMLSTMQRIVSARDCRYCRTPKHTVSSIAPVLSSSLDCERGDAK